MGIIRSKIRRCSANCLLMQEIIKEEEIIILASGTKLN